MSSKSSRSEMAQVALTGLTSVVATDLEGGSARLRANVGTSRSRMETRPILCLPGPGTALLGGILARLNVASQADLEVGSDACGEMLTSLLGPAMARMGVLRHSAAGAKTVHCRMEDLRGGETWVLPEGPGEDACIRPLPVNGQPAGSVGVWCYPTACVWRGARAEETLAAYLRSSAAAGVTQVLQLGPPHGDRRNGEPWQSWLRSVLPYANAVCAQADHLLELLDPGAAAELSGRRALLDLPQWLDGAVLHSLASFLLQCGAGVAVIGLREHGVYLRSNDNADALAFARRFAPHDHVAAYLSEWIERDMLIPLFEVEARNRFSLTDAMTAGFVASLLAGQAPGEMIRMMAAIVSFASERENPLDAVPPWEVVTARVEGGWAQAHCGLDLSGWNDDEAAEW